MPSGVELAGLVGSVHSTIDLIDRITRIFKSFRDQGEEEKDLRLKFETNARILRRLWPELERVEAVCKGLDVSDEERALSRELEEHLGHLHGRLVARLDMASMAGKGVWAVGSRTAWAVWRKRDMCELEQSLFGWIQRVEVAYSVLEANITRRRAVVGFESPEERIGFLVDIYKQIKARDITNLDLRKERQDLELPTNMSRRSVARYREDNGPWRQVIIEHTAQSYTVHDTQTKVQAIEEATSDLAKMLVHSNPDRTLILRAIGYFKNEEIGKYGLVYEIPPSERWGERPPAKITTLGTLLATRPRFSLTDKLRLCCDIGKAVLYVHVMDCVHKGLRPDNILLLGSASDLHTPDEKHMNSLPQCYVAGLEDSRSVERESDKAGDGIWTKNLYRHPDRQEVRGNSEYTMAHDIYSFGVILLEMGLWGHSSVVPFSKAQGEFAACTPSNMKGRLFGLLKGCRKRPGLAAFMGDRYAEVVKYCLGVGNDSASPVYGFIHNAWIELDAIRAALQ